MNRAAGLLVTGLPLILCSAAHAARPLAVDDAGTEPPGRFKLSAGAVFARNGGDDEWHFPNSLSYGLVERLEVGIGMAGLVERRETSLGHDTDSGLGDLEIGAKWQFLDQAQAYADQALSFTLVLPTASDDHGFGEGEAAVDLTWIATRALTPDLTIDLNIGYTFVGGGHEDLFHYGVALEYQLTPAIQPGLEVFADTHEFDFDRTAAAVNGGIRWRVADTLVLDAAVGGRLRGDTAEIFATVGFSWNFRLDGK